MANLLTLAGLGVGLCVSYVLGYIFYNLFLHPLRKYPGPLLMRSTVLGYSYKLCMGSLPFDLLDLHKKYGDIVRISPNELAFADPQAWKDVMGHKAGGAQEFEKYDIFYRPVEDGPRDIISAGREEHGLLRRTMAHGFSDRSMRDQQPIIKKYIDLLIQRIGEKSEAGKKPIDIAAWYNFTTFDVIGDLAFGESFGCLENSDYHPWVKTIFQMARGGTLLQAFGHYPSLKKLLLSLVPKSIIEEAEKHKEMTKLKLLKRMEAGSERNDLISGLLQKQDDWGLTIEKLQANGSILIIGGSETTATLLSGVTFLLLTNPEALRKLTEEVRSTFTSEDEINFDSVAHLKYMLACLDEALRMYPPVPHGLPRVVPKAGANIVGNFIPGGNIVSIHHWAMYHNDKYFKDPFEYHPERWLGDAKYAGDNKDAFQPFHVGARSCLGKNLAYLEMRVILARIVFNFDLKIADESRDWLSKQRIFNLWEKGELNVYPTPAVRK